MEVTYQITVKDWRDAIGMHMLSRWVVRLMILAAIVVIGSKIILLVVSPESKSPNLTLWSIGCLIWVLLIWLTPYLSARKQFLSAPSVKAPMTLEVSDAGLHCRSPYIDSTVSWQSYARWAEGKSVFVLFVSSKTFMVVPKRAFSADQLNQFRDSLRRNVQA